MFKRILGWFASKRGEVLRMDYKDAFMASSVATVTTPGIAHSFGYVPLYGLVPIHPTDNRKATVR